MKDNNQTKETEEEGTNKLQTHELPSITIEIVDVRSITIQASAYNNPELKENIELALGLANKLKTD